VGDVIHKVNGQQVVVDREEELSIFQRTIAKMTPGTSVELSVLRPTDHGVNSLTLFVTLEQAPIAASDAAEYENVGLEFKVRNLVFADYHYYNLDEESLQGVVVSEMKRGGLSSIGGLQIGDIIQRVGSMPVTSVNEIKTVVEQLEDEKPAEVIFFVWRDNKTLFVNVKTDW
jgi:S1-C subfamily serine protease